MPPQRPDAARDAIARTSQPREPVMPRRKPVRIERRRRTVTNTQIRRISSTVWRFLPLRRPNQYAATTAVTATADRDAIAGTFAASTRSSTSP